MSIKEKGVVLQDGTIQESANYIDVKADSIVTVGTNIDGDEVITLIFLNNYPIVSSAGGALNVSDIEKRRVASVTIGKNQAKKFYDSLKDVFGSE
ncbi:hypothetical protein N5C79_07605 [Pantoea brenneri]|uniref:hypothetical protein n=1 Tax=Pantoea brenneri TaxID=472694 RepID=UPI00244A611E|nr:hypothetical protein [Pantoea brenneri]MDH1086347.1 hypothetical protein [Pantoea brenneri]